MIKIGGGDEFILTYSEWTNETDPLSPEMLEMLRNMIKNGRLSKIMNCPGNGSCEYVYFTKRW